MTEGPTTIECPQCRLRFSAGVISCQCGHIFDLETWSGARDGVPRAQAMDRIYDYAAWLVQAGKTKSQIAGYLKSGGMDQPSADFVAKDIFVLRAKTIRARGLKNMLSGVILLVIGLAITLGAYAIASSNGSFIVAGGLILGGLVQIVRGLIQLLGKELKE